MSEGATEQAAEAPVRIIGTFFEEKYRTEIENSVSVAAELRRVPVPTVGVEGFEQVMCWSSPASDPPRYLSVSVGALDRLTPDELTATMVRALSPSQELRPRAPRPKSLFALVLLGFAGMFLYAASVGPATLVALGLSLGTATVCATGSVLLRRSDAKEVRAIEFAADADAAKLLNDATAMETAIENSGVAPVERLGRFQKRAYAFSGIPTRAQRVKALQELGLN